MKLHVLVKRTAAQTGLPKKVSRPENSGISKVQKVRGGARPELVVMTLERGVVSTDEVALILSDCGGRSGRNEIRVVE